MNGWRGVCCAPAGLLPVPAIAVAAAEPPPPTKTFALVVGVNRSMDPKVAPLRYADDDAVRYRDLFRAVGGRTITLASLDENTRRLHPDAASDVRPARLALLTSAVDRLAAEAAQARRAGRAGRLLLRLCGPRPGSTTAAAASRWRTRSSAAAISCGA